MPSPNDFILTTDFPTMKNDATASGTGTVASSVVIAGNGILTNSGDVTIGQIGSLARGRIASSKNSGTFYVGNNIAFSRTGTTLGFAAPYSVFAFMWRVSPTVLRFQILIFNPYSDPLVCEAGVDTISFWVNTFIPPFA